MWSVTLLVQRFVKRHCSRPSSWKWSDLSIWFLSFFLHLWEKTPGSVDAMVHYLISVSTGRQAAAQDKL